VTNLLHSIVLELAPTAPATLPRTMGHQAHALLLALVREVDPTLAASLHEQGGERPFTVSPLQGGRLRGEQIVIPAGETCRLRFTLLDGGRIWACLSQQFLRGRLSVRLDNDHFTLLRTLATPEPGGWAGYSDWQTLAATTAARYLTLEFASPTAFNRGDKLFHLLPDPKWVFESLARSWNIFAPAALQLDKQVIGEFAAEQVLLADYELHTTTLHFPKYSQKGFTGRCSYQVRGEGECAARLAMLAEFARYSGVGYKTTMGMGQARLVPERGA